MKYIMKYNLKYILVLVVLLITIPVYAVTLSTTQWLYPVNEARIDRVQIIYAVDDAGTQAMNTVTLRVNLYNSGTLVANQAIDVPVSQLPAAVVTNLNNFCNTLLDKYLQAKGLVK